MTAKTGLDASTLNGILQRVGGGYQMDGDLDIACTASATRGVAEQRRWHNSLRNCSQGWTGACVRLGHLGYNDGPDAAFLDVKGQLHVFANDRSAQFRRDVPKDLGHFVAIAAAGGNDDGVPGFACTRTMGLSRFGPRSRPSVDRGALVQWTGFTAVERGALFVADLGQRMPD